MDETLLGGFSYEDFRGKLTQSQGESIFLPWLADFIEKNNYPTPTVTDPGSPDRGARFTWGGDPTKRFWRADDVGIPTCGRTQPIFRKIKQGGNNIIMLVSTKVKFIKSDEIQVATRISIARHAGYQEFQVSGYKVTPILITQDSFKNSTRTMDVGVWLKTRMDPIFSLLTGNEFRS